MSFLKTLWIFFVCGIFHVLQGCQNIATHYQYTSYHAGNDLLKKLDKINRNTKNEIKKNNITEYSNYVICLRSQWIEGHLSYQSEAKRRGLDCGVTEKNKTVIASKSKNQKITWCGYPKEKLS